MQITIGPTFILFLFFSLISFLFFSLSFYPLLVSVKYIVNFRDFHIALLLPLKYVFFPIYPLLPLWCVYVCVCMYGMCVWCVYVCVWCSVCICMCVYVYMVYMWCVYVCGVCVCVVCVVCVYMCVYV